MKKRKTSPPGNRLELNVIIDFRIDMRIIITFCQPNKSINLKKGIEYKRRQEKSLSEKKNNKAHYKPNFPE